MSELELKKTYGRILVSLAVAAETNEFEVSERTEQIGNEEFWQNVTNRLVNFMGFKRDEKSTDGAV